MKPKILFPFLAVLAALTSACSPRPSVLTPYPTASPRPSVFTPNPIASPTFVPLSVTPLFVPSAVPAITSSAGKEMRVGFNVRGWT